MTLVWVGAHKLASYNPDIVISNIFTSKIGGAMVAVKIQSGFHLFCPIIFGDPTR
jgi:hypothetical protein